MHKMMRKLKVFNNCQEKMTQTIPKKYSLIEELFALVLEATVSHETGLSTHEKHPLCLSVKGVLAFPQA